jgi:hypothetical protein
MTETTARLALPLLQPGQAQKELYHNEALALIDLAIGAQVEAMGVNTPPPAPVEGQCWVVGGSPTGDWSGAAGAIAGWTEGGWRFVAPRAGLTVWSAADRLFAHHDGDGWRLGQVRAAQVMVGGAQVVGGRCPAIADPTGGAPVDSEARTAVRAVLAALRSHGLIAS